MKKEERLRNKQKLEASNEENSDGVENAKEESGTIENVSEQENNASDTIESEAKEILLKWESGDSEILKIWETMNSWVYDGFAKTYKELNFYIEKDYFESETYKGGKEFILQGLKDNKKIAIEGTLLLRLDIHQIPHIWQTIGEDFVEKIIRPTIRSRMRMVATRFDYSDLVAGKRDAVEVELKNELERIFYPRGIFIENVLLSEIGIIEKKAD